MMARIWASLRSWMLRREVKSLRDQAAICDDRASGDLFSEHAAMRHRWHACQLRQQADQLEQDG